VAQLADNEASRESVQLFSEPGNPELRSLDAILHALGFRFAVARLASLSLKFHHKTHSLQYRIRVGLAHALLQDLTFITLLRRVMDGSQTKARDADLRGPKKRLSTPFARSIPATFRPSPRKYF
jgi:hypothetical protein